MRSQLNSIHSNRMLYNIENMTNTEEINKSLFE